MKEYYLNYKFKNRDRLSSLRKEVFEKLIKTHRAVKVDEHKFNTGNMKVYVYNKFDLYEYEKKEI